MSTDRKTVAEIAAGFEHDIGHSRQVARLSEQFFDASRDIHKLGDRERELLVYAALLHDIGWSEGQQKHHKRSFALIMAHAPEDLPDRDLRIIANVARYHRKALPDPSHDEYAALRPVDREIVRKLGALIRIADGLDATHRDLSTIAACRVEGRTAVIDVAAELDPTVEFESALEKSDLFKQEFGLDAVFRHVAGTGKEH